MVYFWEYGDFKEMQVFDMFWPAMDRTFAKFTGQIHPFW